jgi:uncharacterized protein DUF6883
MRVDGPSSGDDQPHGADRPHEGRELGESSHSRDYLTQPPTAAETEATRKAVRGEIRWNGSAWVEFEPYDHIKLRDRVDRMAADVELPDKVDELPNARDVMPNLHRVEIDKRKFSEYSLNPEHPQNGGKAEGWRALGYDVDDPAERQRAAQDMRDLIGQGLLGDGKVARTDPAPDGERHRVLNGFIGPNERHATLVTCWLVADEGERSHPRLTTTWVQPHKDTEGRNIESDQ